MEIWDVIVGPDGFAAASKKVRDGVTGAHKHRLGSLFVVWNLMRNEFAWELAERREIAMLREH
jgi:hypothetical protein